MNFVVVILVTWSLLRSKYLKFTISMWNSIIFEERKNVKNISMDIKTNASAKNT